MIENIKVMSVMLKSYILTMGKRKKYTFGNKNYDKKESRAQVYALAQELTQNMLKAVKATVEVKGIENLPEKGPVLYVANHKSLFDIVVLVNLIKEPCIFIGKKEITKMPIVGTWFKDLGCIYIDREDMRQSMSAIISGINELRNGQSVVIFPEGTRTHAKGIKDFKEGSFKLATKTKVPIIPIALQDTYKIYEEKRGIRQAKVYVNIGEVISQEQLDKDEQKRLPQYVQTIIEKLLKEITFNNQD